MKYLFFFFWIFLVKWSVLYGQNTTFNKRLHFDAPVAILHSILATDSCYYSVGLVADTSFPYLSGAVFAKFDLNGEILIQNKLTSPTKTYETWNGNLHALGNGFVVNGYTSDSLLKGMLLFYDSIGNPEQILEFKNFFDETEFIISTCLYKGENRLLMATRERNPEGINNTEIVLQYLDFEGNIIWRKGFVGIPLREIPWSICTPTEGIFIIGGQRTNTNLVDFDYRSYDYLLAIDSLGEVLWEYESWPSFDVRQGANSLVATADGGLVVASGRGEEFYINSSSSGLRWKSGLIYKLNAAREVEWEVEFKDMRPDILYNRLNKLIAVRDGSGYVATGHFLEEYPGGQTFDIHGWLVKVSPEGDSLWSRRLRYFEDVGVWQKTHLLNDVKEAFDGGFIMVGEAADQNAMLQRQQAWLIKVDEHGCLVPGCHLVGVEEVPGGSQPEVGVLLSPNPAREFLNVFIKDERIAQRRGAQVRVFDSQGRERLRRSAGRLDEVTNMIPVWGWPAGWYVLVYEDAGGVLWEGRFLVVE